MRAALLAFLALAWFGTLGLRPLYKADEARYAEIPREMAASGDWITPRLNGFKYFEKPPLQYWATALFYETLGTRDWTSRLWAALTGFAGILLVLYAGNRLLGPPAGTLAAAALAGSPLYVALAQFNTLDMGLTFFLTAALLALAAGRPLLFWAACALAVLSKGLVGIVLPLGTVALYVLLKRDWGFLRNLGIVKGAIVFLAISAPWFVAVSAANPEFARFFFIHEHFERFTTQVHQRYEPFWYFLVVLAAGMASFLLPGVLAWWQALRRRAAGAFDVELFLALWALVVLAFFSASSSKLPSYILPLFPALALLAGKQLAGAGPRMLVGQAGLFAAFVAGLFVAGLVYVRRPGPDYASMVPWLAAACLLAIALAGASAWLAWRRRVVPATIALALAGFGATQLAFLGHATIAERFTAAALVASIEPRPPAGTPVYAVDAYDHSLPWYLRRPVAMVAYQDEFGPALAWEPGRFIPDLDAFARAWAAEKEAYAFVGRGGFESLSQRLPMQPLARDARYVFVRKP